MGKLGFLFVAFVFSFSSFAEFPCKGDKARTALVVIDMQAVFVTRGGHNQDPDNKAKVQKILNAIKGAIREAKAKNMPIIFLEYDHEGDTNEELKAAAGDYKEVRYFKKDTDGMLDDGNAFKKELVKYLSDKSIGTLIITGANGGACVEESIAGALGSHCNTVAYTDGIADFNYEQFIYPYVGHYSDMSSRCKNCSFKEVSRLEDLFKMNLKVHAESIADRPKETQGRTH